MIEEIEDAITERIKAALPRLLVDKFPEDVKEYDRLPFQKGVVLVAYQGSDFSDSRTTDVIVQDQKALFQVQVTLRNLRGKAGAYVHLEAIRALLVGFKPAGAGKMSVVDEKFKSIGDGLWNYAQSYSTKLLSVEKQPEELTAILNRVTLQDEMLGETTEVQL